MGDAGLFPVCPAFGNNPARDGPVPFGSERLRERICLGWIGLHRQRKFFPQALQFREGRLIARAFLGVFSDGFNRRMNIGHRGRNFITRS